MERAFTAARFFLAALHQGKLPVRDGKPH